MYETVNYYIEPVNNADGLAHPTIYQTPQACNQKQLVGDQDSFCNCSITLYNTNLLNNENGIEIHS